MKKRALSILVAFALVLALLMPMASAASAKSARCACGAVPEIYIPGWNSTIYYMEGTPEQRNASFVNTDNIYFGLGRLLRGFGLGLLNWDWDFVADGVGWLLTALFDETRMTADGRSVHPVSHHWKLNPEQDHRENLSYRFGYDWRIDPMEAARQLNDFIQAVKAQTGHDKVGVFGDSQGTCIAMAYLATYGVRDLDSFVLGVGAFNGVTVVGEMFCGKLHIDSKALVNYLSILIGDDFVNSLLGGARKIGLLDTIIEPIEYGFLPKVIDRIYDQYLMDLFGNFPSIWAFVEDEYFEDAKTHMLNGREKEYAKLTGEIDDYHYNVMAKSGELLLGAKAKGVKVALMAGYNLAAIPVTETCAYQCDNLVPTANASAGATVAPYGEVLPLTEGKYLSPDRIIDASTCLLPDTTWFFKDNPHGVGAMGELRRWFMQGPKGQTVFTDPRFPQFMQNVDGKGVPQAP